MKGMFYAGFGLLVVSVLCLLPAIILELITSSSAYWVIIKGGIILFGLSGALLGISIAKGGFVKG